MRYLISFGAIIFGVIAEIYTYPMVRLFGHLDWAERKLGSGGTYTAWRLIGLGLIVGGMLLFRYFSF